MVTLDSMPEFIDPKTVADYFDVHLSTVQRWMAIGKLPYFVFGVKTMKIAKADLINFIQESRRG